MGNSQVARRFKNKGQTASKQNFDGVSVMNWVIDLSRGLRGIYVNFFGQLLTSGGTTDPSDNLDTFLKVLGTMQLTLNADGGDIDIIPAGTRIDEYVRFNAQLMKKMGQAPGDMNSGAQFVPNGDMGYSGVTGKTAASPEMFAYRLFIPLGFIGGNDEEIDYAMLVPRKGDQSLTLTITPNMSDTTSKYSPFGGSDRTYTITNFNGTGTNTAEVILDQVQQVNNPNAGLYLPRYQFKSLLLPASTGVQSDIYLNNWERGGLGHAIGFFDFSVDATNGYPQTNRTVATTPGSVGTPGYTSCLRDFYLEGNTERLLEENLINLVAEQHPFPDVAVYNGITSSTPRKPVTPVILNLAQGKSFNGLYDFTPLIKSDLFLNMHFDNLQAIPATQNETVDVIFLRYQKR